MIVQRILFIECSLLFNKLNKSGLLGKYISKQKIIKHKKLCIAYAGKLNINQIYNKTTL